VGNVSIEKTLVLQWARNIVQSVSDLKVLENGDEGENDWVEKEKSQMCSHIRMGRKSDKSLLDPI
jgi:hypothetical protein